MMADELQNWIGRAQTQTDYGDEARIKKLAALLDYDDPPLPPIWPQNELPPLAHWLYFLPTTRQSLLDVDGHPKRGGFMPPITLPRRMWAGSDIVFDEKIALNQPFTRKSEILTITPKTSQNGENLIFVKIGHEIFGQSGGRIEEEQHIVYRQAQAQKTSRQKAGMKTDKKIKFSRDVILDEAALFRFSALTFNAHRIHYDRNYAQSEGYPSLVVQAPFLAILLLDHFLSHQLQAGQKLSPRRFGFRAQRALFDVSAPARLCCGQDDELWAQDRFGDIVMTANIECYP